MFRKACKTAIELFCTFAHSRSTMTALQNPFVSDQRTGPTADDDEENEVDEEDQVRSIQIADSPDLGGTPEEKMPAEVNGREPPGPDSVTGGTIVVEDEQAALLTPMNGAQKLSHNKEPERAVERAERRSEFSMPSSPPDPGAGQLEHPGPTQFRSINGSEVHPTGEVVAQPRKRRHSSLPNLSTGQLEYPGASQFRSINGNEGHSAGRVLAQPRKRKHSLRTPRNGQQGVCDHNEGDRGLWQTEDEQGRLRWFCYHCPGCSRENFFADTSFVSHVRQCRKVSKELLPKGVLTWKLAREKFMQEVEPKPGIVRWRLA